MTDPVVSDASELEQFRKMFGDRIYDPDVFPLSFAHQLKVFRYEQFLKQQKANNESHEHQAID